MTGPLAEERRGPLGVLRLDRPPENRLSRELLDSIADELRRFEADTSISVIAITGTGPWFCAGAQMDAQGPAATEQLLAFGEAWLRVRDTIADLGKPVVASVNGTAFAGGLALTALADLSFAVPHATFGLPELQYGVFPLLVLAAVVDVLPKKTMFDLIYRGRVLTAEEARSSGLVNEVADVAGIDAMLDVLAERLTSANPVALRIGRRAYFAMDGLDGHRRMAHAGSMAANLHRTEVASQRYRQRIEAAERDTGRG